MVYWIMTDYLIKKESILNELIEDVDSNLLRLKSEDSQLNRRNYLRSLFTLYEALLSSLREHVGQLIVKKWDFEGEQKIHELVPLLDQKSNINDTGKLLLQTNKNPFQNLIAYSLKMWAKLIGYNLNILSDNKWNSFKKTINIRHRITHPKFEKDIKISDKDLKYIKESEIWFKETLKKLRKFQLSYLELIEDNQ